MGDEPDRPPQLGAKADEQDAVAKLGFPASATRNTIRVGGGDAAADAAGVASALFPATGEGDRPSAVTLIDGESWQSSVAAAVLAGSPIGAPLLLTEGDSLPAVTEETLERLKPKGSDLSEDAQVIRVGGEVARPDGFKTAVIEGKDPYELAAAVDRFWSKVRGKPSTNVVVVSGEEAQWATPAAAWSARSGDSVLFTRKDSVPAATRKAIGEHEKPNIYLLGPKAAVSEKVERELDKLGPVRRIEGPTPVQNAIAFARYEDEPRNFGWGVVVPGFNFTLASTTRPLDAAAASSLASRGVFAPLLLTDRADALPRPLESYLLSVQPGYEEDPGEAVYNRVWILGDDEAISVKSQGRLDQVTELIPVQANAP